MKGNLAQVIQLLMQAITDHISFLYRYRRIFFDILFNDVLYGLCLFYRRQQLLHRNALLMRCQCFNGICMLQAAGELHDFSRIDFFQGYFCYQSLNISYRFEVLPNLVVQVCCSK
ncbi:hypothetical protein D9M68_800050 [compost metagenome]